MNTIDGTGVKMVVERMLTTPARLQLTDVRHFLAFDVATSIGLRAWMRVPAYWVRFSVVAGSLWRGNIDK